jgi:DAK2 domain fusion protein YloV
MTAVVDASTVLRWLQAATDRLGEDRAAIDALNVFPVADGDTGTNMFLTLEAATAAAAEAAEAPDACLASVSSAMATGALLGARGNSGVIVAQILRAVGDVLKATPDGGPFSAEVVRTALRQASDRAYKAVAVPVEGTMLSVARAASEAADRVEARGLMAVVRAAESAARDALERTPEQLDVLRRSGVVDAGGAGLLSVYEALIEVVSGVRRTRTVLRPPAQAPHTVDASYDGPPFEVMYLFDGDERSVEELRERLAPLGDSLVIVGDTPLWSVHIHVADAGAAIEAALGLGRPHRLRITHLAPVTARAAARTRGIVVVTHGPGIAAMLAASGVVVVPAEPQKRPSTREILDGIERTGAGEVIILPSDRDTRAVAEAAAEQARLTDVRATVIPTRSVVQSLAAVAVHEPSALFDDAVVAMTRAAGATHYGALTVAVREALTSAGPCQVGDVLGLADGDIVAIGPDLVTVGRDVIERLLTTDGELVTLVPGLDGLDVADELVHWLESAHPGVEVVTVDGGQPLWPLILGVE